MSTMVNQPMPGVGTLVRLRHRDWIVLPSTDDSVLNLRPLAGREDDAIGVFLPIGECWQRSKFPPPEPTAAGDVTGGRLLLDAARLALRDGAAPFRSLGRLSVAPRPYQFVPLIMALRQVRARLLIADDVGVGKTIEAAMVARELLDRGVVRRIGVVCPAHLTEQWERELREKFGIDAAVIQPSRFARLERALPRPDLSVYGYHQHLVASVDFVKSGIHRDQFLAHAPDLIIVDEAHTCARPPGSTGRVQHQRFDFIRALAADPSRHLLLVTATPHSGIEESYRSLLGLLDPTFDIDPLRPDAQLDRRVLLPHVVQRRRQDVEKWLGSDTPFPKRADPIERPYALNAEFGKLFEDVLKYCRERVHAGSSDEDRKQRVRHWAAIALLRCVVSSPRAASTVLANRARRLGFGEDAAELAAADADALFRDQMLDGGNEETVSDYVPSAALDELDPLLSEHERRSLASFHKRATALEGPDKDAKLAELTAVLAELLDEGFRPIVFCRFIPTANYLAEWLPKSLKKSSGDVRVVAVTGEIGDEERREKIAELATEPGRRVLVATDCISEGINLQEGYDSVVHYDLPWNPNRIEQREGRVDRFGQRRPVVKRVLIHGANNPIDGIVLDVLIRKAEQIRRDTGVAVPVPDREEATIQQVVEGVLLGPDTANSGKRRGVQLGLGLSGVDVSRLHQGWEAAAGKQREQRQFFAQHGISPNEVAEELEATLPVLGDAEAVRRFLANTLQLLGGELRSTKHAGVYELFPGELQSHSALKPLEPFPARVVFDRLVDQDAHYIGRTHPLVAATTDVVLGRALGPDPDRHFARCGAVLTKAVTVRTVLVLLRFRYVVREAADTFAEEVVLAALEPSGDGFRWLEPLEERAGALLDEATPSGNLDIAEQQAQVTWAIRMLERDPNWFAPVMQDRVARLEESHRRLRRLVKGEAVRITPHDPDVLALYVLVPAGKGAR